MLEPLRENKRLKRLVWRYSKLMQAIMEDIRFNGISHINRERLTTLMEEKENDA